MDGSKRIAISFLSYGNEHIEELKNLLKDLKKHEREFDFFITTNEKSNFLLYNTEVINLPFNYNLKRFPIENALLNNDLVLFLDTDHSFKKDYIDLDFIDDIEDGIYVNWVDTVDGIKYDDTIKLDDFLNGKIKTEINIEYFNRINNLNYNKKDIFFIRESFFLIKIKDKHIKNNFINNWDKIVKDIEFSTLTNNQNGIMEGLIIYLASINSGLKINEIKSNKKLLNFFNGFNHFGDIGHVDNKKLI